MKTNKSFIILGSGGNSSVLLDLLSDYDCDIHGVCDPKFLDTNIKNWNGLKILGDDSYLDTIDKEKYFLVNGLGGLQSTTKARSEIYTKFCNLGFTFPCLVHKSSFISSNSRLSDGVHIMAGVTIQTNVTIKDNVLINTNVSIDHDTRIELNSNISPGVTICGSCQIGRNVFIGAGSTIINGINIGDNSFIRAGSLIVENVPSNSKI